jgi:hypothetical protein
MTPESPARVAGMVVRVVAEVLLLAAVGAGFTLIAAGILGLG